MNRRLPKDVLRGLTIALRFSDVYVESRLYVTPDEKIALGQARAWLARGGSAPRGKRT